MGFEGDIVINGQTSDLGEFKLTLTDNDANQHPLHSHPSGKSKPLSNSFVHSLQVPEEALWQSKGKPCMRRPTTNRPSMLILTQACLQPFFSVP